MPRIRVQCLSPWTPDTYLNKACPYFGIFARLAVFLYSHKVAPTAHAPRGQALLSAVALEDLLDSWELQLSALGLPVLGLALGFFFKHHFNSTSF